MVALEGKGNAIGGLHLGTMGWSYAFWAGDLYPKGLKPDRYLTEYSRHFNSVEVNNTFYRIPSVNTVRTWEKQTPLGFSFAAKFPRVITHVKMLYNCKEETERFVSTMSQLHDKLGPLLLQPSPSFKAEHLPKLQSFLLDLPKGHRIAVEVRNKDLLRQGLHSLLEQVGAISVLTDRSSISSAEETTADFVYVRWKGDRRKVSGTKGKIEVDQTDNIEKWAKIIRTMLDRGTEVFGYFSKYYSGYPPADVEKLLRLV
jgi:uncharacterized protein YecE (DUF72 family)